MYAFISFNKWSGLGKGFFFNRKKKHKKMSSDKLQKILNVILPISLIQIIDKYSFSTLFSFISSVEVVNDEENKKMRVVPSANLKVYVYSEGKIERYNFFSHKKEFIINVPFRFSRINYLSISKSFLFYQMLFSSTLNIINLNDGTSKRLENIHFGRIQYVDEFYLYVCNIPFLFCYKFNKNFGLEYESHIKMKEDNLSRSSYLVSFTISFPYIYLLMGERRGLNCSISVQKCVQNQDKIQSFHILNVKQHSQQIQPRSLYTDQYHLLYLLDSHYLYIVSEFDYLLQIIPTVSYKGEVGICLNENLDLCVFQHYFRRFSIFKREVGTF